MLLVINSGSVNKFGSVNVEILYNVVLSAGFWMSHEAAGKCCNVQKLSHEKITWKHKLYKLS